MTRTIEDVSTYTHYCDVGTLLDFIAKHKLPRDAKVLLQRVEDKYFENHNWGVVRKEGQFYNEAIDRNKKIDAGYFNKEDFPKLEDPEVLRASAEDLEELKEQYYPTWCPVKYKDDNNLYLDAHY